MIKICFPLGCYGNYLARCLYHFTELRSGPFVNFGFMSTGSSHTRRNDKSENEKIAVGHFGYAINEQCQNSIIELQPGDLPVTIVPNSAHWLNYHNNQFIKEKNGDLISSITDQYSVDELETKLKDSWNYTGSFDIAVPHWILRELMSFLLVPALTDTYGYDKCKFANPFTISAVAFFDNFDTHFQKLCNELNIRINVSIDEINRNNQEFVQLQKYYNSQRRCEQWVEDVLANILKPAPVQTLFDESYIQYLFRNKGYEMRCDGLDQFPADSIAMSKLIYKV